MLNCFKSVAMKKLSVLIVVIFCLFTFLKAQTMRVANNNPGAAMGTNVYTGTNALEDAIANSVAGDIIYVVPSSTGYGNNDININIPLTIFGVGILPSKDIGTKSVIDVNCFQCDLNLNASNIRLSGLIIDGNILLGFDLSSTTISDITIENCRLGRIEMGSSNGVDVNNLLVRNSVIEGYGSVATSLLLYITSNITITNNIIFTSGGTAASLRITGATISYNTFISDGNRGIDADLQNNIFDHNIFYGTNVNLQATTNGNVWTNNLSFGATNMIFGAGAGSNGTISGNIENSDPMFTNVPITRSWSDSHDFTLLTGSPALAVSGTDIGPSGGPTPFDAEGNLLPLVQSITVPAVIPVGTDLPVNIKAKGN